MQKSCLLASVYIDLRISNASRRMQMEYDSDATQRHIVFSQA
jgi:hypothetical protein